MRPRLAVLLIRLAAWLVRTKMRVEKENGVTRKGREGMQVEHYTDTRAGWRRRGRHVVGGAKIYAQTREAAIITNADGVEGIAETFDVPLFHKTDTDLLPFLV